MKIYKKVKWIYDSVFKDYVTIKVDVECCGKTYSIASPEFPGYINPQDSNITNFIASAENAILKRIKAEAKLGKFDKEG